ncbi:aspartyl-tRNA synthetase [Ophiocordyceps camponoti-floridani]|uniref:Aspartyl-tRNA synthetase n=1 Tax=Ophiocordyceps camponoti-floridani TaxID=2030778 RepID=A0A8H4VFJ7_9HYPO|nr:aspartyl-tRNA synthetase [Ophiocordyceps camponoti-floridani]
MLPRPRCGVALRGAHRGLLNHIRNSSSLPEDDQQSEELTPGQAYARRAEILRLWHMYQRSEHPGYNSPRTELETLTGFLGKRRDVGKRLSFSDLTTPSGEVVQLCTEAGRGSTIHSKFRHVPNFSPVRVRALEEAPDIETQLRAAMYGSSPSQENPVSLDTNTLVPPRDSTKESAVNNPKRKKRTFQVHDIKPLNSVPNCWLITHDVRFAPKDRHLQIRFHPELQARLRFRSWLKGELNRCLLEMQFVEVETPTLFKSTPEGAREFLVPTRRWGSAYALIQSPQQHKQVLMASGIMRYMQWARCYRDEDARTDRQPEFTQLDLEWAFEDAAGVMEQVSGLIRNVLKTLCPALSYGDVRDERIPIVANIPKRLPASSVPSHRFTTMTFAESLAAYGTDKPDLRIPGRIRAVQDLDRIRQFVGVVTRLPDPIIEVFTLRPEIPEIKETRRFVRQFMANLPPAFDENPDGKPQILICDPSMPLRGFSSLGPDYQEILDSALGQVDLEPGDLVVFQAREQPAPGHTPSSTMMGNFRSLLWNLLVEEGYMSKRSLGEPESLQFAWITEFPMFKPLVKGEQGQGVAGLTCCHHPFTAPLTERDLDLLFTKPLAAKSAAYDLVLNGVEIGGGSRRNHIHKIQELIMRDVLRMPETSIDSFRHLLSALHSGCPPHAGFALGFDRFVALLCDTRTVRDVVAFPKTMKGEDPFFQAPGKLEDEQLAAYGLCHVKPKQG